MKLFCSFLGALLLLHTAGAATFPVTTTADSGAGSLREAISSANSAAGADTISFNIPSSDPNCDATSHVCTITPATALPPITGSLTIDGYTQPGASANTQATGTNAILLIQISGGAFGFSFDGFDIQSTNCLLRGLSINLFGSNVVMNGAAVSGNAIAGCFIGTAPDGTTSPAGNDKGIVISGGAKSNLVGGLALDTRNLISGHPNEFAVMIKDLGTNNNQVLNNLIGTSRTGNEALPNGGGVLIYSGAKMNHVGISATETPTPTPIRGRTTAVVTSPAVGNLISGNNYNIRLADPTTTGNVIEGNLLGTNAAGTAALGNVTAAGIDLFSQPSGNIIGGTKTGSRNIISGNGTGITIAGNNNSVLGNYIGTDITGNIAVPNRFGGIEVQAGNGNIIGGLGGAGNVISANLGIGITLNGNFGPTNDNQIVANSIGVGINGAPLPNSLQGIFLGNSNTSNNTIGGPDPLQGNIIANNGAAGITLGSGGSIIGNAILGNSIHDNVGLGIEGAPATYPVLTSATSSGSSTEIIGTLTGTNNTAYRVEFFASPACDDSGFGEGETFLGFTTVTTNGSATAAIDFTSPIGDLGGQSITATATDPTNTTSGFSACFTAPASGASVLANISTRLLVGTGDNVLIGGFIVTGTASKEVIVRAIGPSLPLAGTLADPFLELHDVAGQLIASNDNWRSDQEVAIMATGLAPNDDLESAIVMTLPPGAYTAILSGTNATTGVALVEVYDLDLTAASKLANISTRGLVQTGTNVMIGGFISVGSDPASVIVRAIGPSLALPNPLANPTLELHDANGVLLDSNNNWRSDQEAAIMATGLAPKDDLESAILMTLPPAAYTAIVSGVNGTSGVALVEVYALE
jgi:hypothetical protein